MDAQTLKAFRFMREHAGYVVGLRAESALQLARAEALLARAKDAGVASVEWVDDDEPYDTDVFTDEEIAAKFESNEWTGPFGCVLKIGDARASIDEPESWASLWGIVVGQAGIGDPYCRVVEAELALEVEDNLRQALGDALDAEQGLAS
jgi:hypothetical protein